MSMEDQADKQKRPRALLGLAGFLGLCLIVSALGGAITATSVGDWYQTLAKPSFNPPDWVFGPVWTVLYIMMAVAGWRIWRRHGFGGVPIAMSLFGAQLALNLAWSFLFFGLRSPSLALIDIFLLLIAILGTMGAFRPCDRIAFWLLVPYALWVTYATVLNAAIVYLN
ncbi:TspO/MBR family protein [Oceanibaculum pacificum]|uniref:TspO protein n=1 Tax=Oceanibaculum pacificum TaxID=580166 RepID=A0A154VHW9_9PROT|nr:TspO/MBR family protein [Oceanibaculum pacificum]KZD00890.1 TspO protein [Oceanibaculum pacificum]